jgi:hypothetical protein
VAAGAAIYAYAVIPNFLVSGDALNMEAVSGDISLVYLEPEGGYIEWPQGPGLGVDLDESIWTRRSWPNTRTGSSFPGEFEPSQTSGGTTREQMKGVK